MESVWVSMKEDKIPSSLEFNISLIENLPNEAKILDLGCGNGVLCQKLSEKGFDVYGIDCSEDGIRSALEADKKSKYFVMDASNMTFESSFFDFIIIKALFTVIPEPTIRSKIMREVNRVLKHCGHIFIADFSQTWHNPVYYKRYLENYYVTGELGLFKVYDDIGQELYTAKHFSQKEIVELYLETGFSSMQFDTAKVKTRSGNVIDGYKILLRKTTS